ncbi:hypothetical protein DFJ73DRAFT_480737 [Zopfochytrium polystomum]|nr:hypothetical protein DFJ73DRAFT_480737 [Zopfochytrium polystomum]
MRQRARGGTGGMASAASASAAAADSKQESRRKSERVAKILETAEASKRDRECRRTELIRRRRRGLGEIVGALKESVRWVADAELELLCDGAAGPVVSDTAEAGQDLGKALESSNSAVDGAETVEPAATDSLTAAEPGSRKRAVVDGADDSESAENETTVDNIGRQADPQRHVHRPVLLEKMTTRSAAKHAEQAKLPELEIMAKATKGKKRSARLNEKENKNM